MADGDNSLSSYLFWGNDPNVNQQLRQRLALQMMASKKAYPKNLGEGLSAIGDAIGEIGTARRVEQSDLAAQKAAQAVGDAARTAPVTAPLATPPPQQTSTAPAPQGDPFATGATPPPYLTGDASDGRDRMAALLAGRPEVPQENPTVAEAAPPQSQATEFSAQARQRPGGPSPEERTPLAAVNATGNVLPGATVAPPNVAAAPKVVQADPPAAYDYTMPLPQRPTPPPDTGPSARELLILKAIREHQGNPYVQQNLAADLALEQQRRAQADKQANEAYQSDLLRHNELIMKREEQLASRAQRSLQGAQGLETLQEQRSKNVERLGFGNMDPTTVYKSVGDSRTLAQSAANGLKASMDARNALAGGAFMGAGAGLKLDIAKLVTGMGLADKHDKIANTETFRAAMQPIVAAILHQTSGMSQLSEGELRFANDAAAGNIRLDEHTIPKLLDIIDQRSTELLNRHDKMVGTLFGQNPQASAVYGVERPFYRVGSEDEANQLPNGTRVFLNGRFGRVSK
jgi:hypothetical protein